jgi:hypothetical protein
MNEEIRKREYVAMNTEKLFYQVYLADVIKDGFGTGASPEEVESICKHISNAVSGLYDFLSREYLYAFPNEEN